MIRSDQRAGSVFCRVYFLDIFLTLCDEDFNSNVKLQLAKYRSVHEILNTAAHQNENPGPV